MPLAPSPAQQAASRANGARSRGPTTDEGKARAARNGARHGLRGGPFALLPGEDPDELAALERAVAVDWRPRDAHERHWVGELVAAMWRQQRLRGLELAALAAAEAENPPSEASLKRLLTFARYGARLDGDLGRALRALRSLKGRPDGDLAEAPARTPEPKRRPPPVGARLVARQLTDRRARPGLKRSSLALGRSRLTLRVAAVSPRRMSHGLRAAVLDLSPRGPFGRRDGELAPGAAVPAP